MTKKITDLTPITAAETADNDVTLVHDLSADVTKKMDLSQLITKVSSGISVNSDNVANQSGVSGSSTTQALNTLDSGKAATAHSHTNATGSEAGFMSAGDKTKLDGVATSATANDTDANLKNRSNHTGTQTMSTISDAGALATEDNISLDDINDINTHSTTSNLQANDKFIIYDSGGGVNNAVLWSTVTAEVANDLPLGSSAYIDAGTGANEVVQLDGSSRLPAVDGSQLTGISAGGGAFTLVETRTVTATNGVEFAMDTTKTNIFLFEDLYTSDNISAKVSEDGGTTWLAGMDVVNEDAAKTGTGSTGTTGANYDNNATRILNLGTFVNSSTLPGWSGSLTVPPKINTTGVYQLLYYDIRGSHDTTNISPQQYRGTVLVTLSSTSEKLDRFKFADFGTFTGVIHHLEI